MEHTDSFSLADEPQTLLTTLLRDCADFDHLSQARLVCVFSQRVPMLHGNPCEAFIGAPSVQGPFSHLFDWLIDRFTSGALDGQTPDYLVVFDAALWPTLSPERKERLVYHELCHLQPKDDARGRGIRLGNDGRPLLKVVPHDIESFNEEIRRYGPEVTGIEETCIAIADGARAAAERHRPQLVARGRR